MATTPTSTVRLKATTTFTRIYEAPVYDGETAEETVAMEQGIYREEPLDTALERYVERNQGPDNATTVVTLVDPANPGGTPLPRWRPVVADAHGFVLDDEMVRAWAAAIEAGAEGWGVPCEPPTQVTVVTGTALPVPQSQRPDESIFRMPGSHYTDDRLFEIDIEDAEPAEVIKAWERAQAAAAGLNAAGVQ